MSRRERAAVQEVDLDSGALAPDARDLELGLVTLNNSFGIGESQSKRIPMGSRGIGPKENFPELSLSRFLHPNTLIFDRQKYVIAALGQVHLNESVVAVVFDRIVDEVRDGDVQKLGMRRDQHRALGQTKQKAYVPLFGDGRPSLGHGLNELTEIQRLKTEGFVSF